MRKGFMNLFQSLKKYSFSEIKPSIMIQYLKNNFHTINAYYYKVENKKKDKSNFYRII